MKKIVYGFIFILAGLAGCDNFNPDLDSYLNYKVQAGTFLYGSVEISPESAAAGTAITLTVTPETGYRLKADSLTVTPVKGDPVELSENGDTWTFTMPASDVTVEAGFEPVPEGHCLIMISPLSDGRIVKDKTTAAEGETVTLTVTPDTGYRLKADSLKVNDGAVTVSGGGNTWTFTMPASNVTVEAEFELLPEGEYSVTISPLSHGGILTDKTSAAAEETVTLTVTPDPGYRLKADSLKVNNGDVTVSGSGPYTFAMPAGNVTVTAQFEAIEYNINISDPGNGNSVAAKVNGQTATTAIIGSAVTLTVTPAEGYGLTSITATWEGGTPVTLSGNGNTRTFDMPAGDVAVEAVFTNGIGEDKYTISLPQTENGNYVSAEPAIAEEGEYVSLVAVPAAGYELTNITATWGDGTQVTLSGSGNTRTFSMPAGDVTVQAVFTAILYNISTGSAQTSKGSVTSNPSGKATVGTTVTLTVNENPGYQLKEGTLKVTAGQVPINPGETPNTWTFTMPANNVGVTAEFTAISYEIVIPDFTNGSVTAKVNGNQATAATVEDTVSLTVSPETNYQLKSISVSKTPANETVELSGSGNNRSFAMPASNVTVAAEFAEVAGGGYTITVDVSSDPGYGTLTPSVNSSAADATITLTANPAGNYQIYEANFKINGGNITPTKTEANKWTFVMPSSEVTVQAQFIKSPGLYAVTGETETRIDITSMTGTTILTKALAWTKTNGSAGAKYLIVLIENEINSDMNKPFSIGTYTGKGTNHNQTIELQGAIPGVTIEKTTSDGHLFGIADNGVGNIAHLILGGNITLKGMSGNTNLKPLVEIGAGVTARGKLTMLDGSAITGHVNNTSNIGASTSMGGGVVVRPGGIFDMQGGTIGGNTGPTGSGVFLFHNKSTATGGVNYPIFTKTGGIIYGSTGDNANTVSNVAGHAIAVYMAGVSPVVLLAYRDSTADVGDNLIYSGTGEVTGLTENE